MSDGPPPEPVQTRKHSDLEGETGFNRMLIHSFYVILLMFTHVLLMNEFTIFCIFLHAPFPLIS